MPSPAHTMWYVGVQFVIVSQRCREMKEIKGRTERLPIPEVVCLAFAAEMFLKAIILAREGCKAPRTHDLSKLFGRVKRVAPEDAAVIIRSVSREFPDYEKVIASAALAFEHWRYLHEYESLEVNPFFLSLFANAIAARACKVLSIDPAIPVPLVEQKVRTWWG